MTIVLFGFILLLVLSNLAIGCYAAICMGYGPPTVQDAFDLLFEPQWLDPLKKWFRQASAFPKPLMKHVDVNEEIAPPPIKETVDDLIQQMLNASLDDLLDDESEDLSQLAPMQELFDDDLASIFMEQGTEAWLMNDKRVEMSLLKLNVVMMKSGRFATDLDARLRSMRGSAKVDGVKRCLDEIRDDCCNYLEAQAATTAQMLKRLDEFGELKYLVEEIDYVNMEQSAQIETTISNLDRLNVDVNPEDAITRLLQELASLRVARHRLRDMQEKTYIKIVLYENRLETVPQQLFFDETTGLRGRIGLDATIFEWWKQKRHEKRQITFSLLDFADFGGANDKHGINVCDKVIRVFGKALEKSFDSQNLVGLYNGNCFMVATPNIGPRKTITEIERIRQRCEKTIYRYDAGAASFKVQLTCAVTEVLSTQSAAEVVKNLESTLADAKKAGRNHTFQYDATQMKPLPEKVDAPDLGEKEKEINLDE